MWPEKFRKAHLIRKRISFTEAIGKPKPQQFGKKTVASSSKPEEAQSSQAGSPTASAPGPSFAAATIS